MSDQYSWETHEEFGWGDVEHKLVNHQKQVPGTLVDDEGTKALEELVSSLERIPRRPRRVAVTSVSERFVLSFSPDEKGRRLVFRVEAGATAKLLTRKPRQVQFVQSREATLQMVAVECDTDGLWTVVSHNGFYDSGRSAIPRGGKGKGPDRCST